MQRYNGKTGQIDYYCDWCGKYLTSKGYSINYLNPPYICSDCKDTGYIGNEVCHCFRQAKLDSTYQQSNATMLLKEENFNTLSHEYHTGEELTKFIKAENASRNFVANFERNRRYRKIFSFQLHSQRTHSNGLFRYLLFIGFIIREDIFLHFQ